MSAKKVVTTLQKRLVEVGSVSITEPETQPILLEEVPEEQTWVTQVYLRCKNRCGGCGSTERLVVRLVVPEHEGGQLVESNGIVLCRTCDLGSRLVPKPGASSFDHPFNFYVSAHLSEVIEGRQKHHGGRASFLRHLIDSYLAAPTRFADLENYQDSGVDVKVNFHMASAQFEQFKEATATQGTTMTAVLRGLLLMLFSKGDANV